MILLIQTVCYRKPSLTYIKGGIVAIEDAYHVHLPRYGQEVKAALEGAVSLGKPLAGVRRSLYRVL